MLVIRSPSSHIINLRYDSLHISKMKSSKLAWLWYVPLLVSNAMNLLSELEAHLTTGFKHW